MERCFFAYDTILKPFPILVLHFWETMFYPSLSVLLVKPSANLRSNHLSEFHIACLYELQIHVSILFYLGKTFYLSSVSGTQQTHNLTCSWLIIQNIAPKLGMLFYPWLGFLKHFISSFKVPYSAFWFFCQRGYLNISGCAQVWVGSQRNEYSLIQESRYSEGK